jgi:hypothetical protein
MRLLLLLVCAIGMSWGQGAVNQVEGPPPDNTVSLFYYNGAYLIYVCKAPALSPTGTTTFYKSSTTITNIVVTLNSAVATFSSTSYLWVGAMITVAGVTGDTDLNGTWLITEVSGSTATFITTGVSDGTYDNAALTLSTSHPLLNRSVWAIKSLKYDGSNNLITSKWAGSGVNIAGLPCSSRASY